MAVINYSVSILLVLALVQHVVAINDVGDMFDVLMERIDNLEANDVANKLEITSLKDKINDIEKESDLKEKSLLNEVNDLKSELAAYKTEHDDSNKASTAPGTSSVQASTKRHRRSSSTSERSRIARGQVEDEVAFYATHSKHDVMHLTTYQILKFEQTVTNKGNAYNTSSGAFTAPVAGTYVFHVTIMGGQSHNTSGYHYQALIDVNGVQYSKMWVTYHDQSSQMLVIDLDAGGVVTIRNTFTDEGFVGQHYSTFSGFLLYEQFDSPSNTIIGRKK